MKTQGRKVSLTSAVLGSLMIAFALFLLSSKVSAQWPEPDPLPSPCESGPTNGWGE
jgi:hypothetical protein